MSVQVLEAEDPDYERLFEIAAIAFARNEPIFDVLYPKHWTEAGRKQGADRMRQTSKTDVNTKFLKAVNFDNEIMGMAKWNIYDNTLPDMGEIKHIVNYWEDDEELAYATSITTVFLQERNEAIRKSGGNLVSLDMLAIDPKYQRRGVGGALVKYGTRKADELGVETVVESSVFGKGLYEKNGFIFQKDVEVGGSGKYSDRPKGAFAWLIRPKQK
jgi:GNAT superfamily N-acetyltransferase